MADLNATIVSQVSKCRSTSFYLAPGCVVYFRDAILVAVMPDGEWVEIKHRRDVSKIKQSNGDWDGSVLYAKNVQGLGRLRDLLIENPARVERWYTDERVIEGRRPRGEQFALHRLCWLGMHRSGGSRQIVEESLPGLSRPLRASGISFLERHRENGALRLSLVSSLRGYLTDDEMAALLTQETVYELQLWAPVDIERYRVNFARATEGLPNERVRSMARSVLNGSSLTDVETSAAIEAWAKKSEGALSDDLVRQVLSREGKVWQELCWVRGMSVEHQAETLKRILALDIETPDNEEDYWSYNETEVLLERVERAESFSAEAVSLVIKSGVNVSKWVHLLPHNTETYKLLAARHASLDLRDAVALSIRTDLETVLEVMRDGVSDKALASVAKRRDLDYETQKEIYRDSDERVRRGLGTDETKQIAVKLAGNPGVDERLLVSMLGTTNFDLHMAIIREHLSKREASRDVIDAALRSDMPYTRAAALEMASREQQRELASRDESPVVLTQLALVANDPEALMTLAERSASFTGRLENPEAGVKIPGIDALVTGLRVSDSETIAEGLVRNDTMRENTALSDNAYRVGSRMMRVYLLEDSESALSESIRIDAVSSDDILISTPAMRSKKPYSSLQRAAIDNQRGNGEMLRWILREAVLTTETQQYVRERGVLQELLMMADNRNELDRETIEDLATHRSPNVRRKIAVKEKDRDVTEAMAGDSDFETKARAIALLKFEDERRVSAAANTNSSSDLEHKREESRSEGDIHRVVSSATIRYDEPAKRREHHPIEYAAVPASVLSEMRAVGGPLIVETRGNDVRSLPNFSSLTYRGVEERQSVLDDSLWTVSEGYLNKHVDFSLEKEDGLQSSLDELSDRDVNVTTELKARVISSPDTLDKNARYMQNCVDSYGGRIARGTSLIIALDDQNGACRLNVHLEHNYETNKWEIEQINTIRNGYGRGSVAPTPVLNIALDIAERINKQDSDNASIKENLKA